MDRDEKILSLMPKAKRIALKFKHQGCKSIPTEDLRSIAMLGAIKAVDNYDPAKNDSLVAYATMRMKSEIIDYIRIENYLSRGEQKKVKDGVAQPVAVGHLLPSMDFVDERLNVSTDSIDVLKLLKVVSLSRQERRIVKPLFLQDVPQAELAVKLHVSPSKLWQMKQSILDKLSELVR